MITTKNNNDDKLTLSFNVGGVEFSVEINEQTANNVLHELHHAINTVNHFRRTHDCIPYRR